MDKQMNDQLKITALSVADLAKLLKKAGSRQASEEGIKEDIEKGAPTNPDGSVNLIHYTAWLLKEVGRDGN
jgi:hypothetical protein